MSNKVLIAFLIVVIAIVIVIINVVVGLFKDDGTRYVPVTPGQVVKQEKDKTGDLIDEAEKIQSKYVSASYNQYYLQLDSEERQKVDAVIDKFLGYINNKDASTIYNNHLYVFYKSALFPTENDLLEYLKKNYPSNEYIVENYEIVRDTIYLPIKSASNDGDAKTLELKITSCFTEKPLLYFGDVTEIRRMQMHISESDYWIHFYTGIEFSDAFMFVADVENTTSKDLEIDFAGSYMEEKVGKIYKSYNMISDAKETIPAKGSKKVMIIMDKYNLSPEFLQLKVNCNGKTHEYEKLINFASLDDDDE